MRVGSRQVSMLRMMLKGPLTVEDAMHRATLDRKNVTMIFNSLVALRYATPHGEPLEGDRKGKMDEHLPHLPSRDVELADALIRICDTSGGFGLSLARAVVEKMAYNARRADHKLENRTQAGGKAY